MDAIYKKEALEDETLKNKVIEIPEDEEAESYRADWNKWKLKADIIKSKVVSRDMKRGLQRLKDEHDINERMVKELSAEHGEKWPTAKKQDPPGRSRRPQKMFAKPRRSRPIQRGHPQYRSAHPRRKRRFTRQGREK